RKQSKKEKKAKSKTTEEQEEDIETILANFKKEQEERVKIIEEIWSGPPSRRANATLTANPLNSNELIFFGGEFYDGVRCSFYNDLYRYNIEKDEWRRITSPNSPGPRSSHQIVITPAGTLFLFGGEFASPNETQFFHYKDFWSLDMKTNAWEKLEVKVKPSSRSGHRMTLWKHFIVLFGGFYDNYVDTRYYDDLWVFDTLEYKWTKVELPDQMIRPAARSGFSFIPCNDGIILYGGYCKEYTKGQRPKGIVHTDTWLLKMNADVKQIRWEKKKKSGSAPSARSGCAMAPYKNRAVLFGGVFDDDVSEETLESTFYNDLYTYQIDTGRWFPMNLKRPKTAKKKKPKKSKQDQSETTKAQLATDKVTDASKDVDGGDSTEVSTKEALAAAALAAAGIAPKATPTPEAGKPEPETSKNKNSGRPSKDNDDEVEEEPLMPCPRYNPMLAVQKSTLFIYGGILEVRDREYTLDDFFSINLDKMNEYICLRQSEFESQLWLGEESDDDDDEEGEDSEDDDDEDEDEENDEDDEDEEAEDKEEEVEVVGATTEGEAKEEESAPEVVPSQLSGVDLAARLAMTEEEAACTPTIGETLREFYGRTTEYWVMKAFEDSTKRGKALRHDGFLLAEAKYNEWQPILAQMAQMRLDAGLDEEDDDQAGGSRPGRVLKMGEVYNKLMSRHRR
ncbi:MAG: galactose oxidase, partial [Benniella sp.]